MTELAFGVQVQVLLEPSCRSLTRGLDYGPISQDGNSEDVPPCWKVV